MYAYKTLAEANKREFDFQRPNGVQNKLTSSFSVLEIRIDWHLYRKIRNPEEDAKLIDLCAIFGNRSRLAGEDKGDSYSMYLSLSFISN